MIELVLIVFLIGVAAVTTVAVKVGFRLVDYLDESRQSQAAAAKQREEIIRLLQAQLSGSRKDRGETPLPQ
jgi:hypothetical protein